MNSSQLAHPRHVHASQAEPPYQDRAIVGLRRYDAKLVRGAPNNTHKLIGAPAGIRTPNQQIMSLLL